MSRAKTRLASVTLSQDAIRT